MAYAIRINKLTKECRKAGIKENKFPCTTKICFDMGLGETVLESSLRIFAYEEQELHEQWITACRRMEIPFDSVISCERCETE